MKPEIYRATDCVRITHLRSYEAADEAKDKNLAVIKAESWVRYQGQDTLMFTHFFNKDGNEVGMYDDCMGEYAVLTLFLTPRIWHKDIMKSLTKWREL